MEDVVILKVCYQPGMRRNAKSITANPETIKQIHGLTRANFDMIAKLIEWLGDNEKRDEKYRFAVIGRLARLEAALSVLMVGQDALTQSGTRGYRKEKLEENARITEEWIAAQSKELGLKMIQTIYAKDQVPEPKRDRRRKWSGWEI